MRTGEPHYYYVVPKANELIKASLFDGSDEMALAWRLKKNEATGKYYLDWQDPDAWAEDPDGEYSSYSRYVPTGKWLIGSADPYSGQPLTILDGDHFEQQYSLLPTLPKDIADLLEAYIKKEGRDKAISNVVAFWQDHGETIMQYWLSAPDNVDKLYLAYHIGYVVTYEESSQAATCMQEDLEDGTWSRTHDYDAKLWTTF